MSPLVVGAALLLASLPAPSPPDSASVHRTEGAREESVVVRIELQVAMHEEVRTAEGGVSGWTLWSARYHHLGSWSVSRWDGPGGPRYTMLPHQGPEDHLLSVLGASGTRDCVDRAGRTWRIEYGGDARILTRGMAATANGEGLRLWYGMPGVMMERSDVPEEAGECRAGGSGAVTFELDRERLAGAGARVTRFEELEVATLGWNELREIAAGSRPPARLERRFEGAGFAFHLRGTIRSLTDGEE